MSIGNNIKNARKLRNLTQKQLADLIDKKEITVRRYEKGDIIPPISVINDIAESLMVSTNDLIPATKKDLEKWDEEITSQIYLSNISTEQLIKELNNRSDFPIKIEIK